MPVGLPHVSSTPQSCRLYVSQIAQAWRDFLLYLDLPSASLYWNSCQTAFRDVKVAASSLFTLGYLTFKPILLILWLVFQNVWKLAQFLAKHLFHQAYISAKKGAIQAKWACREFQKWQSSLSNGQVMIEISILLTLIGLYLLRRYIEKQNYVRRLKTYYRRKKRVIKEVSRVFFGLRHAVFISCGRWNDSISSYRPFLARSAASSIRYERSRGFWARAQCNGYFL
jgi:hypothetical protein